MFARFGSKTRSGLRVAEGQAAERDDWVAAQALSALPRHLVRRLVLGWIDADFRVQIRIFQRFSKSTRKSSSREQILQISAKKIAKFCKILDIFGKFCKILQNFQKSAKILQNFAEFFAEFYRNV